MKNSPSCALVLQLWSLHVAVSRGRQRNVPNLYKARAERLRLLVKPIVLWRSIVSFRSPRHFNFSSYFILHFYLFCMVPDKFLKKPSSFMVFAQILKGYSGLKGQCHGRYHDFWPKFTKFKL